MAYPEPSRSDCGAPWNEIEICNDDGDVVAVVCGCYRCQRERSERDKEESGYYDDLYQQRKDRDLA